ncbi:7519_t:CDS:2 [Funneliformis geosporum]|nr:7519_t:CDS:2 [Funneliformis geosporum]
MKTYKLSGLPDEGEEYDIDLATEILQGCRECIVPGIPEDYVNFYTVLG